MAFNKAPTSVGDSSEDARPNMDAVVTVVTGWSISSGSNFPSMTMWTEDKVVPV